MTLGLDKIFGIHADALVLHSKRAEVLANNLANADTPGFKAKDIDFKSILEETQRARSNGDSSSDKASGMGFAEKIANPEMAYRDPVQDSLDGNTVDKQIETAMFTRNTLQYQANLKFLSGSIKSALTAIRGE